MTTTTRFLLSAGLLCLLAPGALAQDDAAAPAPLDAAKFAAVQACTQNVMSALDASQPPTEQQKAAYKNCYTANGLAAPDSSSPSATPQQIGAFKDCVAARGGHLPDVSNSGATPPTAADFQIISDCSRQVSGGVKASPAPAPPQPQQISGAQVQAYMACLTAHGAQMNANDDSQATLSGVDDPVIQGCMKQAKALPPK